MAELAKRTYEIGWSPDVDAVNAPPGALLRGDNLIHDELGVLALRQGVTKINGVAFSDIDVHSLFTVVRSGSRYRYAGAGAKVYRNSSDVGVTFDGSGDIQFGSHMGQTLIARGTTKKKDDGTEVRNWGIAMTGGTPLVTAKVDGDHVDFATWSETETSEHEVEEDDGNGPDYNQDQDGIDNEAIQLGTSGDTGRAIVKRNLPATLDATILSGGREATDDDYISLFFFADNPQAIIKVTLQIDVNGGGFSLDYYSKDWLGEGVEGPDGGVVNPGAPTVVGNGGGGEAGGTGDPEGEVPLI